QQGGNDRALQQQARSGAELDYLRLRDVRRARRDVERRADRRDAHLALLLRARPFSLNGNGRKAVDTGGRSLDAFLRRMRSLAAGPGAKAYSGSLIGRPVALSTRIGSTAAPGFLSNRSTPGPSGAKCLFPHASSATRMGRKSRPRAVSTYSSRGGRSLYRRRSSRPAST